MDPRITAHLYPFEGVREYCQCCPHDNCFIEEHRDTTDILIRFCEIVSDVEGSKLIDRHLTIINHYFGIQKNTIPIYDVPYISLIIEFFCTNLNDSEEYKVALAKLLNICLMPPVISCTSDTLNSTCILENYFNSLGISILLLDDKMIQITLLEIVLNCLIIQKQQPNDIPIELYIDAIESSKLVEYLAAFMSVISDDAYVLLLEVLLNIVFMSKKSACDLLLNNGIEWLLLHLKFDGDPVYIKHIKEITSTVLWRLMECLSSEKSMKLKPLTRKAIIFLRTWFRYEISLDLPNRRNNLISLICQMLFMYPNLPLLHTGLVEDICLLCIATEFDTKGTWTASIQFSASYSDMKFKQILITVISLMSKYPVVKNILSQYGIMDCITTYLSPFCTSKLFWSKSQTLSIMVSTLKTLPFLCENMPQDFARSQAPQRLILLIKYYCNEEFDVELLCLCLQTFYVIINNGKFVNVFNGLDSQTILLGVIIKTMEQQKLTSQHQKLLSYALSSLTELKRTNKNYTNDSQNAVQVAIEGLDRCIKPRKNDSRMKTSFLIPLGDYIWEYIILNSKNRKKFISKGGIYKLINIIQSSTHPIQLFYTSLLADITEDELSVPQLITWRGRHENQNLLTLLCSLWRKQEEIAKVKRDPNGCILDFEKPIMGTLQKFSKCSGPNCNSPILDMLGCLRPKIFAIYSLLMNRHSLTASIVEECYGIDYKNVPHSDMVTLELIANYEYLKRGEVWWQVLDFFQNYKNQDIILQMDLHYLHDIAMMHIHWAKHVKERQQNILKDKEVEEIKAEQGLYRHLLKPKTKFSLNFDSPFVKSRKLQYKLYKSLRAKQDSPHNSDHEK